MYRKQERRLKKRKRTRKMSRNHYWKRIIRRRMLRKLAHQIRRQNLQRNGLDSTYWVAKIIYFYVWTMQDFKIRLKLSFFF